MGSAVIRKQDSKLNLLKEKEPLEPQFWKMVKSLHAQLKVTGAYNKKNVYCWNLMMDIPVEILLTICDETSGIIVAMEFHDGPRKPHSDLDIITNKKYVL